MPASVELLTFRDRRQDGAFPVFDGAARHVASIRPSFWNRRFVAHTMDGALLCSGKPYAMSRTYTVSDGGGSPLFEVRSGFWRWKNRTIAFADGRELLLHGESWPSRDWQVLDTGGSVVLDIVATASQWSMHPDAYTVRIGDPRLDLAHVVGIVQVNRMLVKAARSAA